MNAQRFDGNHLKVAGSLLTSALVCLFALLSVLVIAIGVQAYNQVVRNADANAQLRTSLSYTANKIRAHDGLGEIAAAREGGIDTLALFQAIEGEAYVTYIYCYDGMLYEWFTAADAAFDPELGEALVPMESFRASVGDNRVEQWYVNTDGVRYTQYTAIISDAR